MIEHDETVGLLLKALDDMGIFANDTIVIYSTDNGPHMNTWPDGAMTPFRSGEEHKLGRRPSVCRCSVRWPGYIKPGTVTKRVDESQRLDSHIVRDCRRARYRRQASQRVHG